MAATAAASIPLVPVSEYLGSVYRPDVDYVDGRLEKRNVGEFDHADLQWAVLEAINEVSSSTGVRARPEVRVQVGPSRFRVPDVCVLGPDWKRTQIITAAPMLCIEVLSPRDNVARMRIRCQDYLGLGTPEVWILDPNMRLAYVLRGSGMTEQRDGVLRLSGTSVELSLDDIFSVLDRE